MVGTRRREERVADERGRARPSATKTVDRSRSSSFKRIDGSFEIKYVSGAGARGDYMSDDLAIGGTVLKGLQMGLALNSTIPSGLIGVGFGQSVAAAQPYPNIMDVMVSQKQISVKAYSLYLVRI
jgi:hypothetical protein